MNLRRLLNRVIVRFVAGMFALGPTVSIAQTRTQHLPPLASESFKLAGDMEVGLEIEARSPGASWARKGAEAVALLIAVDGVYNQDLLLWAGDEAFRYRVLLGRISKGKHTVSVAANSARSARGAQSAEVKSLRPLLFAPSRPAHSVDEDLLALARSPFLFARANTIDRFTDLPLLMYYEVLRESGTDLAIRYTVVFTNEDGGTATAPLMARWGRTTDIEWVYQFRVRGGKIIEETYQGVEHETKPFTGSRTNGNHPLLAVASDNNNFSDLASSRVRFAPLPLRAQLDAATRESVMDSYPQTYRVMSEELAREKKISDTPADVNVVADPREYLYVEAVSEQDGTALAFEAKIAGESGTYSSDNGDSRSRIDRSGYFRTALRLPKYTPTAKLESITARCHAGKSDAAERRCRRLRVVRAFMLDEEYALRLIEPSQAEVSLAPGEAAVFKFTREHP